MTQGIRVALSTSFAALILLGGCGPEKSSTQSDRFGTAPSNDSLLGRPVARAVPLEATIQVSAAVRPLGTIPFDDDTLPLVSPNGEYIATQNGLPPKPEAIFGSDFAQVPSTSRVEIYSLASGPTSSPVLTVTVNEAVLLGRGVDDEGFLVESPRPDGTRWIGKAAWETGRVTWLVNDDVSVNAFATLGPGGALAWSRRPIQGEGWSLVVRINDQEWTLPSSDGDWLVPTFSGRGYGLFSMLLRDGALDAIHMDAADAATMRRTLRRQPLTSGGATVATAVQSVSACTAAPIAGTLNIPEHFSFFHPAKGGAGAAVWFPDRLLILFDDHAWTAVPDPEDPRFCFVTTDRAVERRSNRHRQLRTEVVAGMQIPRATTDPDRPWILLAPSPGRVGITVLKPIYGADGPVGS